MPTSGNVFISVNDTDKRQLPLFAVRLVELGFQIWATEGTASVLRRYGIESKIVDKITARVDSDPDAPVQIDKAEGSVGKNVVELIEEGTIDLILNTPNSRGSRSDGYSIRAAAIAADVQQGGGRHAGIGEDDVLRAALGPDTRGTGPETAGAHAYR